MFVSQELLGSVDAFGSRRADFYYESRLFPVVRIGRGAVTGNDDIGIIEETLADPDLHVGHKHFAWPIAEVIVELFGQIY